MLIILYRTGDRNQCHCCSPGEVGYAYAKSIDQVVPTCIEIAKSHQFDFNIDQVVGEGESDNDLSYYSSQHNQDIEETIADRVSEAEVTWTRENKIAKLKHMIQANEQWIKKAPENLRIKQEQLERYREEIKREEAAMQQELEIEDAAQ